MAKGSPKPLLRSYDFMLGNSTAGSVSLQARIIAHSKLRALQLLREALPIYHPIRTGSAAAGLDTEGVNFMNLYTAPENVSERDIDEVNEWKGP